ncbi:dynamin family protein [Acidithiobacillus caldus]|jgi:predicted GTPase|uniref:Dynamin N-terminal domain-containing protein n=1 Tax=Acidithiobacillus caldus (strain ATCC 51756 / DSM 8584 / KU) TaxID=637389 RepID=A0A059ZXC9_ACICK|nr:dynamin family protein [Acidithiobacillus caldus]AIA54636.1 hypothetical protein Acaty_c0758 [Acidithiobacillus caldus ATCC 51756]MBU2728952.1 hypothetical protein [Acidithiobacillus caldus]MBU2735876.1 hypothetical protein [Acidithiobacillus caldus ATCC 51756]MBU2746001.1 hypothetical protein [Acidithiobacillus caldus]MBU2780041.1 hypothetical protein [Acidithiobacillus caldus]
MEKPLLIHRLQEYHQWRHHIAAAVQEMARFSLSLELLPSGTLLRMESLAQEILDDQLKISFYGEFARGKSELINALFFHDYGARLLPSGPGQTTMCPVEIRATSGQAAHMELLPIRSRSLRGSVEQLKRSRELWTVLPLDSDTAQAAAMAQLTETLCVGLSEARRWGLCPPLDGAKPEQSQCPSCGDGKVRIPRWRYALLRLDHSVLQAGLVILDTPGLNALGSEGDLGLELARDADAVIFVLGADTGVTQSDLEIWEQALGRSPLLNQLVVLNKIDTLWDELKPEAEIDAMVEQQRQVVAQRLNLRPDQIVAVSAQKGLVGRIRKDETLLHRSGLEGLERAIAEVLLPGKRKAIEENTGRLLRRVLVDQQVLLDEQIQNLRTEMESMRRLQAQTGEQLPRLLERQRKLLESFARDRSSFLRKQQEFLELSRTWSLESLAMDGLDGLIEEARAELLAAWTTVGIYDRFTRFFAETIAQFDQALERANRLSAMMLEAYQGLEQQYLLPRLDTVPYALLPRRAELLSLADSYERFGKRLEIAAKPQGVVVRKAFLSLAAQIRRFVEATRRDLTSWVDEALELMNRQLVLYAEQSDEKLRALESIVESSVNIQPRIEALMGKEQVLQRQAQELQALRDRLQNLFRWTEEDSQGFHTLRLSS